MQSNMMGTIKSAKVIDDRKITGTGKYNLDKF
jgi:hypothetical protein